MVMAKNMLVRALAVSNSVCSAENVAPKLYVTPITVNVQRNAAATTNHPVRESVPLASIAPPARPDVTREQRCPTPSSAAQR